MIMGYVKLDAIPEAKYLCDTKEDLALLLPRPSFGDTCWVIEESVEYIYNSKGKWLPKSNASAGVETKVDLTGYATEDYVQEQIQNIEHPVVEVPSKLSELENDANYAQQTYVDAKVADLVNSAPETLDTIGEIAQALKDHQDVADAITEAIGKKADKEDLPSIEGLASETFVTEAIQKIEFPVTDLSNYYTKEEVTQAIVDNAELPEGGLAHQHLITDAEGNKAWEDQTHYKALVAAQPVLEETTFTSKMVQPNMGLTSVPFNHGASEWGQLVDVVYDGVTYHCVAKEYTATPGSICVGNTSIGLPDTENTGEPFLWVRLYSTASSSYMYTAESAATEHTVSSTLAEHYEYITLAEEYLPKNIPMLKEGSWGQTVMVSSNSSEPNAYQAVGFGYLERIMFNDKSIYLNGPIDSIWHSVEYLTNLFIKEAKSLCLPMVERRIWMNSDSDYDMHRIFLKNYYTIEKDNDVIVHLHFDERYPDIILKQSDKSISLDPNWTAPEALPTTAKAHQVLTTNENGEKVWEEKLAYTTAEAIPFLEEFTWDGTQTFFPTAIADANDGDAVTIYIDDVPYTGVLVDDFFTSWLVKFDEEYDNPWIKALDQFSISKKGYNMNIGGAPLTWAVGKLSATVNTDVVHPIDNKYLGLKIKNGSEENSMIINGDEGATGYGAVSINSGRASGTYSVALGNSSASGLYSFAATGGSAKANNSAAFGDWTDAVTDNSVTIGTHNITDENKEYLFIVGNGEKGEFNPQTGYQRTLSNAHTVNKDGTGWFQKEIKVGGVSEHDENAKKVATEEYVNSLLGNKADSADIVQADWDENNSESNAYVMNRPFYDSRTNVIEWDGETSDTIVTIPEMGVTLYRVSDTPLTKAELGTVTYYNFGGTKGYTNLNSDLIVESDGKIISESQTFAFVSVLEDGVVMSHGNGVKDVVFEKKGIYFWELRFSATSSLKTQKIKYGAVTQIPDYYISNNIARQDIVEWINYHTPKALAIYAADLDKDIITEVHSSGYIAGSGYNYTNNLGDALSYDNLKKYFQNAPGYAVSVGVHWLTASGMGEKRQALDLHMGEDGIGFHFIKDITFDETTGQPQFNLKKIWVANPNYVAG